VQCCPPRNASQDGSFPGRLVTHTLPGSSAGKDAPKSASAVDQLGVCRVGAHQHVEILRGTWMAMECDGVAAEHHELGTDVVQRNQDVAKIVREIDHRGGHGTNRQGIVRRV
jgi:hypothetical protein